MLDFIIFKVCVKTIQIVLSYSSWQAHDTQLTEPLVPFLTFTLFLLFLTTFFF